MKKLVSAPALFIEAGILLIVGLMLAFWYAPVDASSMGFSQKIFYYHAPIAETALVAFGVSFVAAILHLRSSDPRWDRLGVVSIRLGLLFSPAGMILGQTILVSPIMTGLTITALAAVSPQIRDTAKSLGATEMQIIVTVIKEARSGVMAAVILGFGRALSEVGVAMMIGGNIRGYTRVLTTSIALETSMGNLELSMALGIILISISLVINLLLNRVRGRWI